MKNFIGGFVAGALSFLAFGAYQYAKNLSSPRNPNDKPKDTKNNPKTPKDANTGDFYTGVGASETVDYSIF